MTFRKKDPELVNLHILGDNGEIKVRKYRVTKYHDFINTLTVSTLFTIDQNSQMMKTASIIETYGEI